MQKQYMIEQEKYAIIKWNLKNKYLWYNINYNKQCKQ